jgi:glutamate/tyrosine decarboxylase-like PLP-dependent enzyme
MEILGFGGDAVCQIALKDGAMNTGALQVQLEQDAAAGIVPLAIVGTAGSVNTGTYDDLNTLARMAKDHGTWLHVDAAFGFWIRIAAPHLSALADGIEHANSIALDGHKWLGVQYDCGACLLRDQDLHRATFSDRAEYLEAQSAGIGAGDWWPTDYGTELSRGMRALKLWTTLKTHDRATISAAITDNCDQAALMGKLVEASPHLTLAHPVISNLCVFTPNAGNASDIAATLQLSGDAVFSTTTVEGKNCLRAAIVNHRTNSQTIRDVIAAVEAQVVAAS